jgi:hypothetical protein
MLHDTWPGQRDGILGFEDQSMPTKHVEDPYSMPISHDTSILLWTTKCLLFPNEYRIIGKTEHECKINANPTLTLIGISIGIRLRNDRKQGTCTIVIA